MRRAPASPTKDTGTGLGLATSYGIIRQSGGDIEVSSEAGEGTVFRVVLPSVPGPSDHSGTLHERPDTSIGGSGELILVVEDETPVRSVIRRALVRAGYRVLEAEDLNQLVDAINTYRHHVDVIVSDVVLPSVEGRTLALTLRSRSESTPVIFMSGYAKHIIDRTIPPEQVEWFLEKPFSIQGLLVMVRSALGARRA